MKLSVMERVVVLDLLPREGDFLTLKVLRELRESLALKEEEIKQFGVTSLLDESSGMINYKWEKNEEVDIPMTEVKLNLIREQLRIIDRNKHLTENQYSVYEKFIIAKEEEDKKVK